MIKPSIILLYHISFTMLGHLLPPRHVFFREFQLVQKCYCSMSGHWVPLWYVSFAEFKFIWQPSHSVVSKNIYSLSGMYGIRFCLYYAWIWTISLACAFRRVPLVQKSCLNYAKTFTTWHVFFGEFQNEWQRSHKHLYQLPWYAYVRIIVVQAWHTVNQ